MPDQNRPNHRTYHIHCTNCEHDYELSVSILAEKAMGGMQCLVCHTPLAEDDITTTEGQGEVRKVFHDPRMKRPQ